VDAQTSVGKMVFIVSLRGPHAVVVKGIGQKAVTLPINSDA
jgi:hypothetical protein